MFQNPTYLPKIPFPSDNRKGTITLRAWRLCTKLIQSISNHVSKFQEWIFRHLFIYLFIYSKQPIQTLSVQRRIDIQSPKQPVSNMNNLLLPVCLPTCLPTYLPTLTYTRYSLVKVSSFEILIVLWRWWADVHLGWSPFSWGWQCKLVGHFLLQFLSLKQAQPLWWWWGWRQKWQGWWR